MARGDLIVFEEAKEYMINGAVLTNDPIWIGLVTDECLVTYPVPSYGAGGTTVYTAIATAGEYAAGGLLLNTIDLIVTEAGGTMTFADTDASVTWAQNGTSPQNADHAVVYNYTTKLCYVMIDLDGPIDMQAGDLTITWDGSGMFTMV